MIRPITTALVAIGISYTHAETAVNRIVASVNGRVITSNEVSFLLAPSIQQLSAQYPRRGSQFMAELTKLRSRTIDELIERELVLHEFKELGGNIPDSAITEDIARQVKLLYNGDRERFLQDLKKNNLTLSGFKELTKRKLTVQAMRSSKFDKGVAVTPSEVRKEYSKLTKEMRDLSKDTISYQKIEIPEVPDNPSLTADDQLDLADQIVTRAKKGEDFGKLAKEYSVDAHKEEGGLWKDLKRSDLSAGFAAIVFDAKEGEIIGPLKGPGHLVVIKIISKTYGPPPPYDSVKSQLENRVKQSKSAEPYERWIERLRKKAIIRRF